MLDVSWVDEQIERVRCATATMQTARDYALLCIARDHLAPSSAPKSRITSSPPTLDDVEQALAQINVSTPEDRRRAQEARELLQIMSED